MKQIEGKWTVHLVGGKVPTELDLFEWAKEVEQLGAGEIILTSVNNEGLKKGFDIDKPRNLAKSVTVE